MLRPAPSSIVVLLVEITALSSLAGVASGDPYLPPKSFFGLDLDPYLNQPLQWPGQPGRPPLSESQIWERLERIAPYTNWVRSYAVSDGLDQIPTLARGPGPLPEGKILGLRTLIGTWIVDYGGNEDDAEVERAFEVASPGDATLEPDIVVIGNEEIFSHPSDPGRRRDWPDLREYILNTVKPIRQEQEKDAVRLTIAEPWSTLFDTSGTLKAAYHDLFDTIDGPLLVNIHPYNEGITNADAFNYLKGVYSNIVSMNPGKEIWIGETGWPSDGGPGASPENAARYLRDCLSWVDDMQIPLMYFMAYDVAWKVDVFGAPAFESHLGVWYNDGTLKIPGDYNQDGTVDADDLLIWQASYGVDSGADVDSDGDTDGYDFLIWQREFGSGSGAATAAVPEPMSITLVLAMTVTAVFLQRGRTDRNSR